MKRSHVKVKRRVQELKRGIVCVEKVILEHCVKHVTILDSSGMAIIIWIMRSVRSVVRVNGSWY